jgi:glutamate-5-semialdehyde dehydrogenase
MKSVRETALAAKRASRVLAALSEEQRNAALEAMALALGAAQKELLKANAEDLKLAVEMVEDGVLSSATVERLKLNKTKLVEMIAQVRAVAALSDPLGRRLDAVELDDGDPKAPSDHTSQKRDPSTGSGRANGHPIHGLHMEKISVPLGVLAVIFEARPDAVTQIAALALKSGNAVILKPGREVEGTAKALVRVLRETLAAQGLPQDAVSLVLGRDRVKELLGESKLVDMVIPRGSKKLVEYVQANTRIPVLGHAEGVCHIYVDRSFDEAMALRVIADAKTDYPAACNAVETVLVHRDVARDFLPKLSKRLHKHGVALHGCPTTREILLETEEPEELAAIHDWHTEYGDLALSIGVVDSLDAAIEHIHAHGSSHTESIITRDAEAAERFLREVDAAGVLHNASTRFADGFRYGFGAEVGVSTSKFHARGPVGLDGLTTYKYVVRGRGHVVGDYRGKGARAFTHKRLAEVSH